jgi:hypothetical protein
MSHNKVLSQAVFCQKAEDCGIPTKILEFAASIENMSMI